MAAFGWPGCGCCTEICLIVCGSIPVSGALIQILTGGIVVDSCTTGPTGCCKFTESGTYEVRVTLLGTVVYDATRTLSGTVTVFISDPSIICCNGYYIPTTLQLTDAIGMLTLGYFGVDFSGNNIWTACRYVTISPACTVTTPGGICVTCATPSTLPIRVCYTMTCNASSPPPFTLLRNWGWVFPQGSSVRAYYSDSSSCPSPGSTCSPAPPPSCGSPLTDTSSGDATPSSSSPFAITFPMVWDGLYIADPIGGNVTVSQ